jgi:hypothetical protein
VKKILEAFLRAPSSEGVGPRNIFVFAKFLCDMIEQNREDALGKFCMGMLQRCVNTCLKMCLADGAPAYRATLEGVAKKAAISDEILHGAILFLDAELDKTDELDKKAHEAIKLLDEIFAFREKPPVKTFAKAFGSAINLWAEKEREVRKLKESLSSLMWNTLSARNIAQNFAPPLLLMLFLLESGITTDERWGIFAAAYKDCYRDVQAILDGKILKKEREAMRQACIPFSGVAVQPVAEGDMVAAGDNMV